MEENNSIGLTYDAANSGMLLWDIASKNDLLTCCHHTNGKEQKHALWTVAGDWGRGKRRELKWWRSPMLERVSRAVQHPFDSSWCQQRVGSVQPVYLPQRSPRRLGSFLHSMDRLVIGMRSASRVNLQGCTLDICIISFLRKVWRGFSLLIEIHVSPWL